MVGQVQSLPVMGSALPGRSYEAISNWSLPVLNLEAHGRCHVLNRGQLPPLLGLG